MSRLLAANFMRLKKNISFWSGIICMFGLGIYFPVKSYMDMMQTHWNYHLDDQFYFSALLIGIVMAEFCSMFLGTEYSDGTIRNKIIAGQKRATIYLANVITSSVVSVIMCIVFALSYLCVGIPLLGFFTVDIQVILLIGLAVLCLAAVLSAIFTLITMICQNKATAAVMCILLAFGFILVGGILNNMLEAPEMTSEYSLSVDGNFVDTKVPNPKYLDGIKREIVQTIYDIIPGGQEAQCALMSSVNLPRLPFYSLGLFLLTTGAGVALFRKRDLR